MSEEHDRLWLLDERLHEPVRLYLARIKELWRDRALSVDIYGPAASRRFEPEHDLISSALVLESIELERLHQLASDGTRFGAYRIAAPMVFTPELLQRVGDTFPLELIEIRDERVNVLGDDFFTPLKF